MRRRVAVGKGKGPDVAAGAGASKEIGVALANFDPVPEGKGVADDANIHRPGRLGVLAKAETVGANIRIELVAAEPLRMVRLDPIEEPAVAGLIEV